MRGAQTTQPSGPAGRQLGHRRWPPPEHDPKARPPDIWALHAFATEATNAAYRDQPAAIIWHFQLR